MQVTFYNAFSKRKNSTKRPANTDTHYDIDVVLKEDTTIEMPSLVLTNREGIATGNPVTVLAQAGNMVNPVVTFEPVQTGTGTPSPLNPRPIVPYTSINVDVNGNVTAISLNGDKCGGVLDLSTGVLTVKYYYVTDLGAFNWYRSTLGEFRSFYTQNHCPAGKYISASVVSNAYCPVYQATTPNNTNSGLTGVSITNQYFSIGDQSYPDATSFKTAMNGITLCYELATYETVQLTPAQIALVMGSNTVSVNGNSTISFGYIAEEIATDYVYAYIPKWNKYYFVATPNILTNFHVQYDLEEDYLASRKTEVGSTVAHVVYSSTGYDKYKTDPRLPVKTTTTSNHVSAASGFSSTGCYIISIISDKSNGITGGIAHFLMDTSNMANLTANLYDVSISSIIAEAFYSPMDLIANCIWLPISYSDASSLCSAAETISLNQSPINTAGRPVYGSQVTTPIKTFTAVSLAIPSREQDFRDMQPYTSASLYLPGVGMTDLNINDFSDDTNVNIYTRIDITNGDIIYWIYNDNGEVVKTISFNGAESVPLAHIGANSKGALTGIGGAAAMLGAAALGVGSPASLLTAGSLMAAGNTALSFNQRAVSMKGGYSGRSSFADTTYSLTIVKTDTEDPDNASYIARCGRPVGVTHAISNHSGYVQCEAASVALAGDNTEREIINNYLNTGFYYE